MVGKTVTLIKDKRNYISTVLTMLVHGTPFLNTKSWSQQEEATTLAIEAIRLGLVLCLLLCGWLVMMVSAMAMPQTTRKSLFMVFPHLFRLHSRKRLCFFVFGCCHHHHHCKGRRTRSGRESQPWTMATTWCYCGGGPQTRQTAIATIIWTASHFTPLLFCQVLHSSCVR